MNEVRLSAPPELAGAVDALDQFLRYAEEPIDSPVLDSFGDALQVFSKLRTRIWQIQNRCQGDAIARFRMRSAATTTGLIVLALVSLPDELLDVQLERLENFVTSTNATIRRNREEMDHQEITRSEAEIEARARKMDVTQIVKEAEANDVELSADAEGRILVKGQLSPHALS
jgi:hypothetical protein